MYVLDSRVRGRLVNNIRTSFKTLNDAEDHFHLSLSDCLNSMHLERDDGQPTRRLTRSVGTNTDDSAQPAHLPTDVTRNLEQSKLRHALIIAINR